MTGYEKIYDFKNLFNAHKAARKGKRGTKGVIDFEMKTKYIITHK